MYNTGTVMAIIPAVIMNPVFIFFSYPEFILNSVLENQVRITVKEFLLA